MRPGSSVFPQNENKAMMNHGCCTKPRRVDCSAVFNERKRKGLAIPLGMKVGEDHYFRIGAQALQTIIIEPKQNNAMSTAVQKKSQWDRKLPSG
jgi:hypothetical protein